MGEMQILLIEEQSRSRMQTGQQEKGKIKNKTRKMWVLQYHYDVRYVDIQKLEE